MSFDSLGLSADILRTVAEQGYSELTPIQRQAIPVVLASAQTGTGKTAGFTLPLLQKLSVNAGAIRGRPVRAAVVVAVRLDRVRVRHVHPAKSVLRCVDRAPG